MPVSGERTSDNSDMVGMFLLRKKGLKLDYKNTSKEIDIWKAYNNDNILYFWIVYAFHDDSRIADIRKWATEYKECYKKGNMQEFLDARDGNQKRIKTHKEKAQTKYA